jgi:hypothetical protein
MKDDEGKSPKRNSDRVILWIIFGIFVVLAVVLVYFFGLKNGGSIWLMIFTIFAAWLGWGILKETPLF